MKGPFTKESSVRAADVDFAVFEAGPEGKGTPDVVMLHGNPDTHAVWSEVATRLASQHHCIAPDLPGYGRSHAPDDLDCSLAHQGETIAGLLDALGLERVHLVVHDVGGPYGLSFAAQQPKRLRSLTICNTGFFPDQRWHFWARVWRTPILGEMAMALSSRSLFIREMKKGGPRLPRAYIEQAWDEYTPAVRKLVLRWYRAMDWSAFEGWDKRLLEGIADVPRQVLWGDHDTFLPKALAERFAAPAAHVHHFTDCGHWVMAEDPERTATRVAELVASADVQ